MKKLYHSIQSMISAFEGNFLKKLLGAEGILLLNFGCLIQNIPATRATILKGVTYRIIAAARQRITNKQVARGSLQLNSAWNLSPCVAMSPTTIWIRPATLLNLSYLIFTTSCPFDVGNVSNSSSSSSGLAASAQEIFVSMWGGWRGLNLKFQSPIKNM